MLTIRYISHSREENDIPASINDCFLALLNWFDINSLSLNAINRKLSSLVPAQEKDMKGHLKVYIWLMSLSLYRTVLRVSVLLSTANYCLISMSVTYANLHTTTKSFETYQEVHFDR